MPVVHRSEKISHEIVKEALYLTGLLPDDEGEALEVIALMNELVTAIHHGTPPADQEPAGSS
jgi:hypothetical protein